MFKNILDTLTVFHQGFVGTYIPADVKDQVIEKFAEAIVATVENAMPDFKRDL